MSAMAALKLALTAMQIAGPVFQEILEAIQKAKAGAPDGKPSPEAIRTAVVETLIDRSEA